ncbi:MAG: hypothetical protein L0Y58_02390 [Verrucomicrobia subdivision 3 bacterium]|nr:hypothetical protein [Limisphaerales bacterium]
MMDCARFISDDQHRAGSIRVRVKVRRSDSQPSQLQWVLEDYPADDQIDIADAGFKQKIVQAIKEIKHANPNCSFGENSECRFDNKLEEKFDDPEVTFVTPEILRSAPAEENQSFVCTLCVIYLPQVILQREFQALIAIKTLATRRRPVYFDHLLGEANSASTAKELPVKLAFAQDDLDNALRDKQITNPEQAKERVTEELLKAADKVFEIAVKNQLLDAMGKVLVQPNTIDFRTRRDVIADELKKLFDLQENTSAYNSVVSWGKFDVIIGACCDTSSTTSPACENLCADPQKPTLLLMVAGVQIIRSVSIKVMPDDLDRDFIRTETGRALNKKRKDAEKGLNLKFLDKLAAKPGHIVTSAEITCDQKKLCKESLNCTDAIPESCDTIKQFERLSSRPRIPPNDVSDEKFSTNTNLVYQVLRKLPADREILLKGGGGYSSEEKFLAKIGLEELNILHFGERLSLDFARGPEVQKVLFQFARPFKNTKVEPGWRLKDASISVNYLRDNDQRLGNLTPGEIAARETGSNARLSFGYDSFARPDYFPLDCKSFKDRKRTHWTLTGETALQYRDVTIPDSDKLLIVTGLNKNLLPAAKTQITYLSLDLTAGVSHDFQRQDRAGLGQVSLSLDTRLQRGLSLFGADYIFGKAFLAAHGEALFGKFSPQDILLRHTRGIASGTGKTPIFELFRLGGPQNVRGIEEGEFIGRRLTFEQTEFGVNSLTLWRLLRKTSTKELNRTPCSEELDINEPRPAPPIDFSNLYLKAFFDRARISDPTSFNRPPGNNLPGNTLPGSLPFQLDRRATGYGFAVELRNLTTGEGGQRINLSIGYARSPQSKLHRSGTLFTTVSIIIH